jgi:hypothetical protein
MPVIGSEISQIIINLKNKNYDEKTTPFNFPASSIATRQGAGRNREMDISYRTIR